MSLDLLLLPAALTEANHGGGYSYRLAPASSPLTEATFRKLPLEFVGQQMLRWGGGTANGGKQLSFNATYATTGTTPPGSMWAKNPIPRNDGVTGQGYSLAPGCEVCACAWNCLPAAWQHGGSA